MSEPLHIALVGSTGLVGRKLIEACSGRSDVRLIAISRREVAFTPGVRMEMIVSDPASWGEVIAGVNPQVLISALGTTWKKAGESEEAFRAVDQDLVISTARAARKAGVRQMVSISAVGADPASKNFYLSVKGEVDRELSTLGFKRLDILRPGLLKGERESDRRAGERLGIAVSPFIDPFLRGRFRSYRSIDAQVVAQGALGLAERKAAGRFTHDGDSISRMAREWVLRGR